MPHGHGKQKGGDSRAGLITRAGVHIAPGSIQVEDENYLGLPKIATADLPAAALGEGRAMWDEDKNIIVVDDGAYLGNVPFAKIARKAASQTINSDATLTGDNNLFLTLGANEIWYVSGVISYDSVAAADFQIAWSLQSGATMLFEVDWAIDTSSGVAAAPSKWTTGTLSNFGGSAGSPSQVISFTGIIVMSSTPGVNSLQWAQGTLDIGDTTLLINSFLAAWRVG